MINSYQNYYGLRYSNDNSGKIDFAETKIAIFSNLIETLDVRLYPSKILLTCIKIRATFDCFVDDCKHCDLITLRCILPGLKQYYTVQVTSDEHPPQA